MRAPNWFQRELRLIHPLYFAVYDSTIDRWQIRKWEYFNYAPKLGNTRNWDIASKNIIYVRREDYLGADIGYEDLSMKTIRFIKEGLYHARNMKRLVQEVDRANDKREENYLKDQHLMARQFARDYWRYYQEPSVDYGARSKY